MNRHTDTSSTTSRRDTFIATGLTLGSAIVIAAIMVVGDNQLTETIGYVMFPGVLSVGTQWMHMRERSGLAKVAMIGGTFVVLFLIGLLAGVLNLVPILGFWITFILALAVALFTPEPLPALLKTGGVLLAVQMLEQHLLGPRIVGRQLGVKPVILLLTMLGLSLFLGFLGFFLAAPVIGVARAAWALWVRPYAAAAIGEGEPS